MLDVDGVEVVLGGRPVLRGVSLDVREGEVVAVLGPSGSGKTTLLRSVAGLAPVSAGRISLDGIDVTSRAVHERGIGLMFQDYALFPHLDVSENVAFGLRMRGDGAAERRARVDEVLALVELPGYRDRSVSSLSGGERQRVALARALAPAPRLLMLDEPLGALDRSLRERLQFDLQRLVRDLGLAVLHVTHDQEEAMALADSVVLLRDGRVVQSGSVRDVWERPVDGWAARFLGAASVIDVEVAHGRVVGPWGLLIGPVDAVDGRVALVVRPDGVRLDGHDGERATVEGHAFTGRGTRVRLRVGSGRAPDRIDAVVEGPPPPVGTQVAITIDPAAVLLVPSDGAD